jgi:hypothetical protein
VRQVARVSSRSWRSSAVALGAVLAAAAPAHAGKVTIGSNLAAGARHFESAPVDSVYWNTRLASHRKVRSPKRGEVSIVRLKGRVKRPSAGAPPPNVVLHVQVLRPMRDGRVKVIVTSGDLRLPFGGARDRITTYRLQRMPARVCVRKGDYVAMSTSGGFGADYPDGAQFQMFGAVPGSAYAAFTGQGEDMDGDVLRGRQHADRELLMQTKIATGADARPSCR